MGSTLCTAGPFFINGEPDYDAPKRAVVDALRALGIVNIDTGEPWKWGDECRAIATNEDEYLEFDEWPEDMVNKFNEVISDAYDQRYHESVMEEFEQLVRDINDYKEWAEPNGWRSYIYGHFANGTRFFMHAGEDYGRFGYEVGDMAHALVTKWFALTGWRTERHFNLEVV